ncbi:MAG: hypothetical protein FJ088_04205, partial [Deltaproteobacteria bacterium]|nr:hypothetical protein [Deltaproteobacteria bacterium]
FLAACTISPEDGDRNAIISLTHYLYDTGGIAAVKQFAKFLDTGLIGAGALLDEIARGGEISKDDCASFLQSFEKTFSRKLSVFYVPDASEAEKMFDVCVEKHPEGADVFRQAMAPIYKSAGK